MPSPSPVRLSQPARVARSAIWSGRRRTPIQAWPSSPSKSSTHPNGARGLSSTASISSQPSSVQRAGGSWCSPGKETSWNAHWRVNGERGVAIWDGEGSPEVDYEGAEEPTGVTARPEDLAGVLAEFVASLRTGRAPSTEVHANILSLAMVEAAIRSAETGSRVLIADVLGDPAV